VTKGDDGKALAAGSYALRQIPKVDGALVALDPHTGRVLAMVGGSAAVARQLHIRIEFFADGGSERRRQVLAQFGALMVALLFALITGTLFGFYPAYKASKLVPVEALGAE
jgi:TRAP-type mannitol/chloroaromatic compound transport system permease small subunit